MATGIRSTYGRAIVMVISAIAIATSGAGAPSTSFAQSGGPESVADLAAPLLDAVVNISTSQNVNKPSTRGPAPRIPEGSPFQEFFKDFFDGEGENNGGQKVNSLGSGFVISPEGFIVTNNHVIEGADDIEAVFPSGLKLKAKLVGTDTKTDLSVLKVEPKTPLKFVKFGDSRTMRIGDWVMAIGNPFGLGGSLTVGIISARGRNINAGPYDNFIQTDAAINKGNSGGPLFNLHGEVIGINTAIISPSGGSIGIGFAVPTELAENIINQLIEFGETRRGWLGIRVQPVTEDIMESLGLKEAKGALVSGIVKDGPIDKDQIKTGDVILSFDGKPVTEMRDLPRVVAESAVGKEAEVVLMRDGKEMTVKVVTGRLDDAAAASKPESVTEETPAPQDGDDDTAAQEPQADPDLNQLPDNHQNPQSVMGMKLIALTDETRAAHGISDAVEGVLVESVDEGSPAAQKGIKTGDVIVEVGQDFMEVPVDVLVRMNGLKSEGRRNAHCMVASPDGSLRFVALPLE